MRRITVEEIKEAYKVTGLKPCRCLVDDRDGGACAIGALHIASQSTDHNPYRWGEETFGKAYCNDFIRGFDGSGEIESVGYRDGRSAALAIFAEGT